MYGNVTRQYIVTVVKLNDAKKSGSATLYVGKQKGDIYLLLGVFGGQNPTPLPPPIYKNPHSNPSVHGNIFLLEELGRVRDLVAGGDHTLELHVRQPFINNIGWTGCLSFLISGRISNSVSVRINCEPDIRHIMYNVYMFRDKYKFFLGFSIENPKL